MNMDIEEIGESGEPATPKKKDPRRIEIDLKLLTMLSSAGCSVEEIAAMLRNSGLKINLRTLKRRLAEPEYKEAREQGYLIGNAKLRSNMFVLASLRNSAGVQMCKFLAVNRLGMTDKTEVDSRVSAKVEVTSPHARFLARLDRGAERLHNRIAALAAAVGAELVGGAAVAGGANDAPAVAAAKASSG